MCVCCISSGVSEPWAENEQLPADPEIVRGSLQIHGAWRDSPKNPQRAADAIAKLDDFWFFWGESREVPADWKVVNVVQVFKKGNEEDPRSYRPVSVTSFHVLHICHLEIFSPWRFFPPECSSAIIIHCYFFSAFHLTVRCLTSAIFLRKKGKLKGYS